MIKVWLLITAMSLQGWPSVKYTGELFMDEQTCETKRIYVENKSIEGALKRGYSAVHVETWCLETSMFNPSSI